MFLQVILLGGMIRSFQLSYGGSMRVDAYLEPVSTVEQLRLHLLNRDEIVWDIVERTESIVVLLVGQKHYGLFIEEYDLDVAVLTWLRR